MSEYDSDAIDKVIFRVTGDRRWGRAYDSMTDKF